MKTFPTSAVWCFGILFISVLLKTTGSSEVVGSADPVVAVAGDDVILPCSLKPSVSAEDMTVRWTRLNLKTRNVHLYLDGRDSNEDQSPSYRGRTSMFHEELKNGNVSLKLINVTLSDAGRYRCFLPTLTSQVKETTVQLLVGAVSQPVISIVGTKDWGFVLKCESGGWFPEPEMEWLDSSGTILPADGPPEMHRDSEGLYAVRQHVTVNKTDTNRFTCRVNQPEINHLKETEIHVPDLSLPASLSVSPDRSQFYKYESVSLSCEVQGNSTGWRVVRNSSREIISECNTDWGKQQGSSCIMSLILSDSGVYWCESESGEHSNAVNITVHAGAVILESPALPVTGGDSVTLRCRYQGTPSNLTADFYKDGSLIRNETTGEMTIPAVSKSDEGLYKCTNSEGESPESWMTVTGDHVEEE